MGGQNLEKVEAPKKWGLRGVDPRIAAEVSHDSQRGTFQGPSLQEREERENIRAKEQNGAKFWAVPLRGALKGFTGKDFERGFG